MGSMTDALSAFAAHCDRATVDRRPSVFAQYIDIWQTPRGEIGAADPQDIARTCFALLTPWATIPTFAEAWLIVDTVDALAVVNLKVNVRGMFNPHWSVPYEMADDGSLSFGEPMAGPVPREIAAGIQAAKSARFRQTLWEADHSIESVMPVVVELLSR